MKVEIKLEETEIEFQGNKPFIYKDTLTERVSEFLQDNLFEEKLELCIECDSDTFEFGGIGYDEDGIHKYDYIVEVDYSRWEMKNEKIYFDYTVLD
jgi:hypothetical protein